MLVTMVAAKLSCGFVHVSWRYATVLQVLVRFTLASGSWSLIGLEVWKQHLRQRRFMIPTLKTHLETDFHGLEISLTHFWTTRCLRFGWIDHI